MACLIPAQILSGPLDSSGEAHLDECAACRHLVATLLRRAPDSTVNAPVSDPSALLTEGDEVAGRYVVLCLAGAGATAVVYGAYDPSLDRRVALKLLRPAASDAGEAWLTTEAQTIARLRHPNIVVVHDLGLHDGRVFLTLDYVEEGHLGQWLVAQPRTWQAILKCFTGAGRGLAAAHAAGIVHRDFKPQNVLVGPDSVPMVTDFGLSTLERRGGPFDTEIAGTPAYMAPEHRDGRAATYASDQFSFCVALWEALSGSRPGPGITAVPSKTKVPEWVWSALRRGLSVDPGQRFADMTGLLRALDPALAQRRRIRTVAGGGVAALTVMVGIVVAVFWERESRCDQAVATRDLWSAAQQEKIHRAFSATGAPYAESAFQSTSRLLTRWVKQWAVSRRKVCEASAFGTEQSSTQLVARMACLDRRRMALTSLQEVFEHAQTGDTENAVNAVSALGVPEECETVSGLVTPVTGALYASLTPRLMKARVLTSTGQYAVAREMARGVIAEAEAAGAVEPQAEGELILGDALLRLGDGPESERVLYAALAHAEQSHNERLAIETWINIIITQGTILDHFDEAMRSAQVTKALLHRQEMHDLEIEYETALGRAYRQARKFKLAEEAYRRALAMLGPEPQEPSLEFSVVLGSLAVVANNQGRFEESLELHAQALAIKRAVLGSLHPVTALELNNLGFAQWEALHYEEALASHRESLAIRQKVFGPKHVDVAWSLSLICLDLTALKRLDEALVACRSALELAELPGNARALDITLNYLGSLLNDLHQYDEAAEVLLRNIRSLEVRFGPTSPRLAFDLAALGSVYLEQGRPEAAIDPLERSFAIHTAREGAPIGAAATEFSLARALIESGADARRGAKMVEHVKEMAERLGQDGVELADDVTKWENARRDAGFSLRAAQPR